MQGILMPEAELWPEERSLGKTKMFGRDPNFWIWMAVIFGFTAAIFWILGTECFAQVSLPGSDASDKLEAAGTLLRLLDTALFKWGARLFAGICIMSAAWSLKEQRFGIAIICIVGALIFGTAPTWVKNIFSIGAGDSIFGN